MCGWPGLWTTKERGRYNISFSDYGSVGDRPFVYILLEKLMTSFILYTSLQQYIETIYMH